MSNKHDVNVRKSALINFQIGLIASLLFTYTMFEVYTSDTIANVIECPGPVEDDYVAWNPVFVEYVEPEQKVIAQKHTAPVVDPQTYKEVDDDTALTEFEDELKNTPPVDSNPFDTSTLVPTEDPYTDVIETLPFTAVEDVPVFPGCEKLKTNREKAACFNEKISRIISRKFNADIGGQYGLSGKLKIYTAFDVSPDGTIQNVQVRAPHPKLKEEAERVIGLFPKMTPGMQRKRPVTVKYQLPIMFKVED